MFRVRRESQSPGEATPRSPRLPLRWGVIDRRPGPERPRLRSAGCWPRSAWPAWSCPRCTRCSPKARPSPSHRQERSGVPHSWRPPRGGALCGGGRRGGSAGGSLPVRLGTGWVRWRTRGWAGRTARWRVRWRVRWTGAAGSGRAQPGSHQFALPAGPSGRDEHDPHDDGVDAGSPWPARAPASSRRRSAAGQDEREEDGRS